MTTPTPLHPGTTLEPAGWPRLMDGTTFGRSAPLVDTSFPARAYQLYTAADATPVAAAERTYVFAGEDDDESGLGTLVTVEPIGCATWEGVFAFGYAWEPNIITTVVQLPDGESFAVVSDGALYTVRADDPSSCQAYETRGVQQVTVDKKRGLVLFAAPGEVIAFGSGRALHRIDTFVPAGRRQRFDRSRTPSYGLGPIA